MAKTKEQKQQIVQKLISDIEKQNAMIFVDFKGLKVKDMTEFRKQLKQIGAKFQVAKKTLLGKALQEKRIELNLGKMAGQIAVVFSLGDPISVIKNVFLYSKSNQNVRILGGYFENQLRDEATMRELAMIPSRDELLSRLVGSIRAPLSGFLNVVEGPMRSFVFVVKALAEK